MQRRSSGRVHDARDGARGCRDRQADEVFAIRPAGILRHGVLLNIEPRQPRRAAQQEQERKEVAGALEIFEDHRIGGLLDEQHSPHERERRGSEAERDHVSQRIHLAAEIAHCVGHARDAAVETVQENSPAKQGSGRLKMEARAGCSLGEPHRSIEHFEQRVESQENISRGEQRRQRVGRATGAALRGARIDQAFAEAHAAPFRRAITLDPAATRSPTRTLTSHSGPRKTSTREPNLMSPMRSPLLT